MGSRSWLAARAEKFVIAAEGRENWISPQFWRRVPSKEREIEDIWKILWTTWLTILMRTKKYLPINANVRRHESEPYDKLERNLISLQALIGTSMRRTSLVKRGAFRNKMQRVAKRKYPACNRHVVIIASLSPVPPRCCVNHESLSSIFSCIWFVTW